MGGVRNPQAGVKKLKGDPYWRQLTTTTDEHVRGSRPASVAQQMTQQASNFC